MKTQTKIYLENHDKELLEIAAKEKGMSLSGLISTVTAEYLDTFKAETLLKLYKNNQLTVRHDI